MHMAGCCLLCLITMVPSLWLTPSMVIVSSLDTKHLLSLNVTVAPLFMACLVENRLTVASGTWSTALRVTSVQPLAV